MMTKIFLLLIATFTTLQINAQTVIAHKSKLDILYYHDSLLIDNYTKGKCKLDIHYPENTKDYPTLIWLHGGWLKKGSKEQIPDELLKFNLCIVSVNYRLSPEVKAPDYLNDVSAAIAWVFNNIESFGGDTEKIFIAGHSAGGYLTSMIGLDKKWLNYHGIDINRVAGLISLSGQTVTHTTIREEKGLSKDKIIVDEFAPLNHTRKDAPPLLLITGDRNIDIPGRYEENLYLKKLMDIAGHKETKLLEMQGYGHMMINPALPIMIKEIDEICEKIDKSE